MINSTGALAGGGRRSRAGLGFGLGFGLGQFAPRRARRGAEPVPLRDGRQARAPQVHGALAAVAAEQVAHELADVAELGVAVLLVGHRHERQPPRPLRVHLGAPRPRAPLMERPLELDEDEGELGLEDRVEVRLDLAGRHAELPGDGVVVPLVAQDGRGDGVRADAGPGLDDRRCAPATGRHHSGPGEAAAEGLVEGLLLGARLHQVQQVPEGPEGRGRRRRGPDALG